MSEHGPNPTSPPPSPAPTADDLIAAGRAHLHEIQGAVEGFRGVVRLRYTLRGVALVVAVVLAALAVGIVLFGFAPGVWWLRALFGVAALGAGGVVLWRAVARPLRPFHEPGPTARYIEERLPELRSDVSASLQLGRDLTDIAQTGRFSLPLVHGVLEQTREALQARQRELPAIAPRPDWRGLSAVALGSMLATLILSVVAPGFFAQGLQGLLRGEPEATVERPDGMRRAPIVADITLNFNFPAYTGIGHRAQLNSTGDIEVLRGTEITFEGVALQPVERAELVLRVAAPAATAEPGAAPVDGASGEVRTERVLLERRPGNRLVATFPATGSGTYTIEARLPDGSLITDGIERPLIVHEDALPRVTITQPEGEVDVAPDDLLSLEYHAGDDFGLTELAIVTYFPEDEGSKKRKIIKSLDAPAAVLPGDARPVDLGVGGEPARDDEGVVPLDLLQFNLQPRDRLVVYLEAVDNDTVTGPKLGLSEPLVLRVSSAEDKHLEIIAEQEKLVEALLLNLADFLEFPVGARWRDAKGARQEGIPAEWDEAEFSARYEAARPPNQAASELIAQMHALLERMEQDPLMVRRDFELFKQTHDELYAKNRDEAEQIARMAIAHQTTSIPRGQLERLFGLRRLTIRATEQGIIRLEDLIASQRMENLLDTAKSLKEARERLRELLEKYKETQDPALKAEIMREIQRLKQRMQELMAKMQAQIQNLPREHVNMEALEKEGLAENVTDLNKNLNDIQDLLDKGDLEGALQALDQMGQNIDAMLGEMEQQFAEMQPDGLSAFDKKVAEVMDELNNLQAQEEQIAEQTDKLSQEMEEQNRERMEQLLNEFMAEQMDKVREIEERLDQAQSPELMGNDREELDKLRKNAESLKKALESRDIAQAMEQAESLEQAMEQAQGDLRQRSAHLPRNSPRGKAYNQANESMRRATPQAEEVAQELRDLMERAQPRPSAEQQRRMDQLGQEQSEVRDRVSQLQSKLGEMGQDAPTLQEQLGPGLGEAQQFMEGAEGRLGQGEGRKAHENEKLALDKLGQLRQQLRQMVMQQKMGNRGENGQRELSHEEVAIPDADRSAPRAFREDLMDAMKEGGLDSYESEIKQYYESLVK